METKIILKSKLKKYGGSLFLLYPAQEVERLDLCEGDEIEFSINKIVRGNNDEKDKGMV